MTQPLDTAALLADLAAYWRNPEPDLIGRVPSGPIAGSEWDQPIPEGIENPYWQVIRQLPLDNTSLHFGPRPEPVIYVHRPSTNSMVADRGTLCATYAWAICSPGDITWMKSILGGRGVVEPGAGSGYWAWQLRQAGVDVAAYDPYEVEDNPYTLREWTTVLRDGHGAPAHHPDRALFLCWPDYDNPWAAHSLASYRGDLLIYAGEGEGGCCADDSFFKLLDAEWEPVSESPHHVSYWAIHCCLTAYRRLTTCDLGVPSK